jgi:23S rRNA (pseudouridine1915-N3)-methyltransferase
VRLTLLAVGRLPARSPEAQLVADYLARAAAAGRSLGLQPVELQEVEGRRPGKAAEAEALAAALEPGTRVVACDEHGEAWTSRALAERVGRWRDDGVRRLAFVIGGADGLDAAVLARADHRLAFGALTWPHALARVMLAEQVYRAASLLAGSPYHRD